MSKMSSINTTEVYAERISNGENLGFRSSWVKLDYRSQRANGIVYTFLPRVKNIVLNHHYQPGARFSTVPETLPARKTIFS